ncbi:Ribosome biogenesis regulatory protein-like [Cricetulus griseus]|uniref:Ribosome biogenesis regulatory protein n=1 Tax=Cricetulus griseus TaxID=10029 RepID=G3I123_CRIGR|nr:Ribosome biogenesis regulatory protein-like [Cricetulus griseus]
MEGPNVDELLAKAGPLAQAELRTLARDNTQLLISQLLASVRAPKGHQAQEDQPILRGQWRRRWVTSAPDDTKEWLIQVPGGTHPMEDQFAKQIQAKKEHVAKNELNRLQNLARASTQGPDAQLSQAAPSGTPEEGGAGPRHAGSQGLHRFGGALPGEPAPGESAPGHRQEEDISAPLGTFQLALFLSCSYFES